MTPTVSFSLADNLDRALDIAARSSAEPGPDGVPIQQQIEATNPTIGLAGVERTQCPHSGRSTASITGDAPAVGSRTRRPTMKRLTRLSGSVGFGDTARRIPGRILTGDLITALNGTAIPDSTTADVLAGLEPGQIVSVVRTHPDGSSQTVQVSLGQYRAERTWKESR
jgi:hypothetical protein